MTTDLLARVDGRYAWLQNSLSLLDQADEREVLPHVQATGLGYTPYSPLAGGWLTGKYAAAGVYPEGSRMTLRPEPYRHLEREAVFRGLERLADEARARQVDLAALAVAWVLHQPRVDAAIIGPRNLSHLTAALGATAIELSDEDAQRIGEMFRDRSRSG